MPGRTTTRSKKSDTSAATNSDIADEGPVTSLRTEVCAIFGNVQHSNTAHRKSVVRLRKIQESCCYEPANEQSQEDYDENDFNEEVARCMTCILPVKKGEPVGDRIIKFLGMFLKHSTELDNAIFASDAEEAAQNLPETPTSRLTSRIISLVLPLLQAKDKIVRFRAAQIIAHLINTLDSVDDELFDHIRLGLLKRLRDKETNVRVQAVYGLGRLADDTGEDGLEDDSDDDSAGGVLERLLDLLQNDPSTEVRKTLLLNLPFTAGTLPLLLERARDQDASIRRTLYSRLLPALGDFRHLSLTHREKLLRWGLRDRDENVRKATARLFRERWIEDCVKTGDSEEEAKPGHVSAPSMDGLLELLERIDIVNAGMDGGIALDAMKEFWDGRPDYRHDVTFDEEFWKDLTPEGVFVARTFNDHCKQAGASDVLSEKMPEVTRVAYLIQSHINALTDIVRKTATDDDAEEDSVQHEFIVEQLLHMALTLDYSDEMGRRSMYSLMREVLALAELPEETTRLVIQTLRCTCGASANGDRDFCAVVLEAIAEVHDTIMGDDLPEKDDSFEESFHSARSDQSGDSTPKKQMTPEIDEEKAVKEIMVNMKCLHIAQCMLQEIDCSLEQNAHLVTMLNNLVVPAVRSQEAPIRERGLLCLGLCCLLDKNLADENLSLFLHCFSKGNEQLQTVALQIIGDILAAHPTTLSPAQPAFEAGTEEEASDTENPFQKPIHKMFSKSLRSPSQIVQSTACAALCKLMLAVPSQQSGKQTLLRTDDLLRMLVMAYFDPDSSSNPALRQTLSYFLPVYCHSRKENLECMGRIALSVLHWYVGLKEEIDVEGEDESDFLGPNVVLGHLVDWTDGQKLALAKQGVSALDGEIDGDQDVHVLLAEEILDKIIGVCSKDERKFYISMLGKLTLSHKCDLERLNSALRLCQEAINDKVAVDAPTRNTLVKTHAALEKCVSRASNSRPASRGRSTATDQLGDTEAADSDNEIRAMPQSAMTTPAASPRKQSSRATTYTESVVDVESGKIESVEPQLPAQDADGDITMGDETPVPSPRKKTSTNKMSEAPVLRPSGETFEQPSRTPAASPRRRTAKQIKIEPDLEDETQLPTPAASPRKSARGRPRKTQAPVETSPESDNVDSEKGDKENEPPMEQPEETAEKIRVRPTHNATSDASPEAEAAAAKPPPRKSVRASRRKTVMPDNES